MIPLDAPSECSYNCVGCEHLKGVVYYDTDDVEVECDLDEYPVTCVTSKI